jgi:hypothetical protein
MLGSGGPSDEGCDDVVAVAVEVAAGPVVAHGHPGVGVSGGDLRVTHRDPSIKARGYSHTSTSNGA